MNVNKVIFYKKYILGLSVGFLIFCFLESCNSNSTREEKNISFNNTRLIDYRVISFYPHDTLSFTEGLVFYKKQLYESTGSPEEFPKTESSVGIADLKTGILNKKIKLDKKKYFGEGIAFLNDKLFQLTYKAQVGFIYNATTFNKIGKFNFTSTEGWGLTTDGTDLIMSDGTSKITFLDPITFKVVRIITVTESNTPQDNINELEFINGFIYANIFTTNFIDKIDPNTGNILGKLDLSILKNDSKNIYPNSLEMNGIAYDSATHKIFITGKFWPRIYVINFL